MAARELLEGALGLAVVLAVSGGVALLLALTQRWHGRLTLDGLEGVQKAHSRPTARVGGVALLAGPVALLGVVYASAHGAGHGAVLLNRLCVAGLPAFAAGLAEDLTKRVGVLFRLLATMASGLLACAITGVALTRLDIAGIDPLLHSWWLALPLTAFCVGGVANSINIIDGFNGLSGFTAVFAFAGYALLAAASGDGALALVCLVMGAAALGFLLVNWPRGLIFLGDGGAYFCGFSLAWLAVLLVERHPQLSAFAVLLVLAHPVTEVLFSIYRRKVRKQSPGMPDRLHFHSLVKRRVVDRAFPGFGATARNSITGALVGCITLVLAAAAWLTRDSVAWSAAAFLAYVGIYITLYARLVRFGWCSPLAFVLGRPRLAVAGAGQK